MSGNSHLTSPLRKCDKVKWTWLWNGKAGTKGMKGQFTITLLFPRRPKRKLKTQY